MADIDKIINILRRATVVVKVAPFGFVIMHLVSMFVYMFTNDYASSICDMLFYISYGGVLQPYSITSIQVM